VGADRISEPEYHFLTKIADRTVSIADVRRSGIEVLSEEAARTSLAEPYFQQAYERYSMVKTDAATALSAGGTAPKLIADILDDNRLDSSAGTAKFVHVDGCAQHPSESIRFETFVGNADDNPSVLDFELVDTSTNLVDVEEVFEDQASLDERAFEVGKTHAISDTRLKCTAKRARQTKNSASHRIRIEVPTSRSVFFRNRLLTNDAEATRVAEIVKNDPVDRVVTPFSAQAQLISQKLGEENEAEVSVLNQVSGNCDGHAVVSLVVANDERRVYPPVSDYEALYCVLTAGEELTVIGHEPTLSANNLLGQFIKNAERPDAAED
jgi:hypothetical protein